MQLKKISCKVIEKPIAFSPVLLNCTFKNLTPITIPELELAFHLQSAADHNNETNFAYIF